MIYPKTVNYKAFKPRTWAIDKNTNLHFILIVHMAFKFALSRKVSYLADIGAKVNVNTFLLSRTSQPTIEILHHLICLHEVWVKVA